MRPNSASESVPKYRQTCWSDNPYELTRGPDPPISLMTSDGYPSRLSPTSDMHFGWSEAILVGLGGLEPPTSSLSAIMGLPLCNPAFLQVARIRNRRSNALFERAAEGRSRLAREVRPQGSRHSHSHAVLALRVPLTCTKPLPDQPIQHPIPRPAPPLLNLLIIRQQTHSP
jgi:hypothetical protein